MRNEKDMFDLIMDVASDERIRAVLLNGSRTNPNAPKDKYQDYDIVYIVNDIQSFKDNCHWIDIFGERVILQMPESMRGAINDGHITYLMLFEDKNRIDLSLEPIDNYLKNYNFSSDTEILLDKDSILGKLKNSSDVDYFVSQPTKLDFDSCCNDILWCSQNVAKGIKRDELSYAMGMLQDVMRPQLHEMLDWFIGISFDYKVSTGKFGKYYKKYLNKQHYEQYQKTYCDSDYEHVWNALFAMLSLFKEVSEAVAIHFGYKYPKNEDKKVIAYLQNIRG